VRERLGFERELAELGLRERENGHSPPATEVMIGEQVTVDLDAGSSLLAGADLEKIQWTIPGTAVAKYWGDFTGSEVVALRQVDLTRRKVTFYWVDAQDGRVVTCRAVRNYGPWLKLPVSTSFAFDVKAPTVDRFRAVTSEPQIVDERGVPGLRFGRIYKTRTKRPVPGIQWNWKVTMHSGRGGDIKDLQTIRQGRQKVQLVAGVETKKMLRHPQKGPHDQLDEDPHDGGEPRYSAKDYFGSVALPLRLKAGESFENTSTRDSPGTTFEQDDRSMTVDESFKYYLLYRPDTPGAIWVPLAVADWFWKAKAAKGPKGWALITKSNGNRVRAPTAEHPIYGSNVNENKWIDVGP
jgi:hypothetical protein